MYIVSPYLGDNGVTIEQATDRAPQRPPDHRGRRLHPPPVSHLTRWTSLGADLVIYSGGKGIRGPQGTGCCRREI